MFARGRLAALVASICFALLVAACPGRQAAAPPPTGPSQSGPPVTTESIDSAVHLPPTSDASPVDLPEPGCEVVEPVLVQPEGTPQPDPQPDIGGYVGKGLQTTGCSWALGSMPLALVTVTLEGAGPDGDFGSMADNVSYTTHTDDHGCYRFKGHDLWPWRLLVPATIGTRSIQCDSDAGSPVGTVDVVISGTPPNSKDNRFGY